MCNECPWLPAMATVNPWRHGEPNDTYEMLYHIFLRDFVNSRPTYQGREVWHFPEMEDGKIGLFWHLTSRKEGLKTIPRRKQKFTALIRDQSQAQRYPDLRRAERLPWVRTTIDNYFQPQALAWDYLEGDGNIHTYIWLKEYDFVVIMKKYSDGGRRLITSFYIDNSYKRQDFERKYTRRL